MLLDEAVIHVIDVMAIMMNNCYRIEAVKHVIDMMAMVMEMMDIVIG